MRHSNEEQLDNFIRSKLATPPIGYHIQPSADFTAKVMRQIGLIQRRQRWAAYLAAVLLSLVPLAAREIWLLIRGDYFSVSSLPMGQLIVGAYNFFLSPAALYILLALGILAFLLRANKLRRGYSSFPRIA